MLKRFTKLRGVLALFFGLSFLAVTPQAMATYPTVVASSTAVVANSTSFGYINKLVVDPTGNIFVTDSSNGGALWEIPVGTTTPVRVTQFVLYASVNSGAGGSGYSSTAPPTVIFSAPPAGGTTATGTATVSAAGVVTGITMTYQGSGYTANPTVTFSSATGSGAAGTGYIGINSTHGFTVDKYGDVFVADQTSGNLYFLPNRNGKLSTTSNAAGIEPLDLMSSYGIAPTLDDYYGEVGDVAIDGSGNLYAAMTHCNSNGSNACGTSGDSIFLFKNITNATTAASIATAGTATLFIGALPGGKVALNIALDSAGANLYYVDGANLYAVSTATANGTPAVFATGFKAPSGVSFDASGNLYIVDNSTKLLYEIPNESGKLNPADQFVVASMTNPYYSVGFDPAGNVLQADGTDKNIDRITLGALNVGTVAAGGPVPVTGVMNFRFNTQGGATITPTAISLLQGTGSSSEFQSTAATTCKAGTAYANGGSCAVTVSFAPSSTGVRRGAIVLVGAANKALNTAYLSGTGSGAGLTADPGTQTALTAKSAWVTPGAIAMDGSGNTYVADAGANTVQVISASGAATASIGSGLSAPGGVSVDGAGNVFIADTGNNRVVEVPNEAGTLNTADQFTVLPSATGLPSTVGFNKPLGIFAGPDGGLYVADSGNKRVLRYQTFDGLGSLVQTTIGSGYTLPVAVTTDGNGNVFVADQGTRQIDEINLQTTAQATVLSAGLSVPSSIALDASGALYVVDTGLQTLIRYPSVGGAIQPAAGVPLSVAFNSPQAIAVNGAGNMVVTDNGAAAVGTAGQQGYFAAVPPSAYTLVRTAGTVAFGSVDTTQSSVTETVTLTSNGTSPLTLGATPYTATGSTAAFAVAGFSGNACTGGLSLAVGTTCGYSVTFAPTGLSTFSDKLTFSSNAVNAASLSELLTGTGINFSQTTTNLTLSPAAPYYSQAITVLATIAPTKSGNVPTGTVTFYLDGIPQKIVDLSSSTPYTAQFIFPALAVTVGTHALNASYSGDANNASSDATPALILTVAKEPTVTTASISPSIALLPGSSFTFSGTVTAISAGTPTGTISLVLASAPTASLATTSLANGVGGISYAPPSTPGLYTYQLVYSGDANFAASISGAFTVQIANAGYTVAIPATSYTVSDGSSVTIPITVTGIGGYAGNVTVGGVNVVTNVVTPPCTGLPQYVTCTFSPGIVAMTNGNYPLTNAVQVMNLTIATSVPPAAPYAQGGFVLWPGCIVCLVTLAVAMRKRRKLLSQGMLSIALLMVLGSVTLGLGGCGSGRGTSPSYASPKGAANITVNFSGSPVGGYVAPSTPNITNTTSFQLTVQ